MVKKEKRYFVTATAEEKHKCIDFLMSQAHWAFVRGMHHVSVGRRRYAEGIKTGNRTISLTLYRQAVEGLSKWDWT